MRNPRKSRTLIGTACATALALGSASAHAADPDWLGIVYLWGSGVTIDARDQTAGVDFEDLIDDLEMSVMGHVEAQGDNFGGFVDVVFVGTGANQSRTNFDLNTDNDMMAMDLAVVWSPGPERFTGLELYGGLRSVDNDFHVVANPVNPALPTFEGGIDKRYTDVLLGARYGMPMSENWRAIFMGDISGGDTEGTFSLAAYAAYRTGQHHFYGGYRHFEMDLESGAGESLTVTMTGPVIAYGYSF